MGFIFAGAGIIGFCICGIFASLFYFRVRDASMQLKEQDQQATRTVKTV
jgi:uncharacterized membrane protein YciS (DUF1049 family)